MQDYKILGAEKRRQRQNKIPQGWTISLIKYHGLTNVMDIPNSCGVMSDRECDLTSNYDATALLVKLKTGALTAEEVTTAFCKRAAIAQQLTNCLTEIFFDEAIERARDLDRKRKADPSAPLPPLYGLPISLKDSFDVAGSDTSTGLGCFVNDPAKEHSSLAALLLDLGAVLYCKTNLPQTIMTGDSDNKIFGRTLNPRNIGFTAGGSTGGEGALIALKGSVLGVGTDIAGSIRVPSLCNGIYGFRTSVGVVPHDGVRDLTTPGTDGVRSTAGPMATSLRDVELFMRAIMEADTWRYDSTIVSLPWTGLKPAPRIRLGLVLDNGMFTPTPPMRRGLSDAAQRLSSSADVEIIPLTLPDIDKYYMDLFSYMTLTGPDNYLDLLSRTKEPVVPSLEAIGLLKAPGTDLKGFLALNVRRQAVARRYRKLFIDNNIDAILTPAGAHTALPHDKISQATYTSLWNYLDYPALVMPVGEVGSGDFADDVSNAKYGPADQALYSLYTGPEEYVGAPIAVQLVGYRHRDEALLGVAKVVNSIINSL